MRATTRPYPGLTAHASNHESGGSDAFTAALPQAAFGVTVGVKYVIGDTLLHSHDAEGSGSESSYTLRKAITLDVLIPDGVAIRIKFDLKDQVGGGATAYGRIYKNGVAIGTERSNATSSYVTYSEDLTFREGDRIELWTKENTGIAWWRNLRLYGTDNNAVADLEEAIDNGGIEATDALQGTNS